MALCNRVVSLLRISPPSNSCSPTLELISHNSYVVPKVRIFSTAFKPSTVAVFERYRRTVVNFWTRRRYILTSFGGNFDCGTAPQQHLIAGSAQDALQAKETTKQPATSQVGAVGVSGRSNSGYSGRWCSNRSCFVRNDGHRCWQRCVHLHDDVMMFGTMWCGLRTMSPHHITPWNTLWWAAIQAVFTVVTCHTCDTCCHQLSYMWNILRWAVIQAVFTVMICDTCDTHLDTYSVLLWWSAIQAAFTVRSCHTYHTYCDELSYKLHLRSWAVIHVMHTVISCHTCGIHCYGLLYKPYLLLSAAIHTVPMTVPACHTFGIHCHELSYKLYSLSWAVIHAIHAVMSCHKSCIYCHELPYKLYTLSRIVIHVIHTGVSCHTCAIHCHELPYQLYLLPWTAIHMWYILP